MVGTWSKLKMKNPYINCPDQFRLEDLNGMKKCLRRSLNNQTLKQVSQAHLERLWVFPLVIPYQMPPKKKGKNAKEQKDNDSDNQSCYEEWCKWRINQAPRVGSTFLVLATIRDIVFIHQIPDHGCRT